MLVIDLYSEPGVHERANQSLLRFIKRSCKEHVLLIGDQSLFDLTSLDGFRLNLTGGRVRRLFYRELLLPIFFFCIVIFSLIRSRQLVIIGFSRFHCLSVLPLALVASTFVPCSVLFHSQIEMLNENGQHSIIRRLRLHASCYILKKVLTSERVRCLFLSSHIEENCRHLGINLRSCYFIPHPVSARDYCFARRKTGAQVAAKSFVPVIGAIGIFRQDTKNSMAIYEVAKQNPDVRFKLVGRAGPGFSWVELDNVENVKLEKPVSDDLLYELSSDIDTFIYLFPEDSYKYTASGTIVDALIWRKSIIYSDCAALRDLGKICEGLEVSLNGPIKFQTSDFQKLLESRDSLRHIRRLVPSTVYYEHRKNLANWLFLA